MTKYGMKEFKREVLPFLWGILIVASVVGAWVLFEGREDRRSFDVEDLPPGMVTVFEKTDLYDKRIEVTTGGDDRSQSFKNTGHLDPFMTLFDPEGVYWVGTGLGVLRLDLSTTNDDVTRVKAEFLKEDPEPLHPIGGFEMNDEYVFFDGNSTLHQDAYSQWCKVPRSQSVVQRTCYRHELYNIREIAAGQHDVYILSSDEEEVGNEMQYYETLSHYHVGGELVETMRISEKYDAWGLRRDILVYDERLYVLFQDRLGFLDEDGTFQLLEIQGWPDDGYENFQFHHSKQGLLLSQSKGEMTRFVRVDPVEGKVTAVSEGYSLPAIVAEQQGVLTFFGLTEGGVDALITLSRDTLTEIRQEELVEEKISRNGWNTWLFPLITP